MSSAQHRARNSTARHRRGRKLLCAAIAAQLLILVSSPAQADGPAAASAGADQSAVATEKQKAIDAKAADKVAETATTLDGVVVMGQRASLDRALDVKQADDHVVEVIAADNMGQLPNITVAQALVRLPGVNGARDRGNESLATVRGLGPRMTLGTVNDREIASSEPTRAVRWEVFPTEVVSAVKVYKTQSADLIAGGIAATVDIATVNPLDYAGPAFVGTAGPVYYTEGKDVPGYSPWVTT